MSDTRNRQPRDGKNPLRQPGNLKYMALAVAIMALPGCVYEPAPPPLAGPPPAGYYAAPCCYSYYEYPPYYYGPSLSLGFQFGSHGWHGHHGHWR